MKSLLVLALAVVVIFIAYPLLVSTAGGLDAGQAKAFVLDDLKPVLNQGMEARIVNVEKKQNQWAVDVLLTRNAHTPCPFVEKRFYTLMPIGFRSENVVDSCNQKVDINYREEALIQSAKLIDVGPNPYGCAFFCREYKQPEAKTYCPSLNEELMDSFAQDLPEGVWLAQWAPNTLAALSKNGQLLKHVTAAG